ncbi:MAG: NAD-binding protein [Candidatus Riflebacteria bacterium]|nr:NAD-binding protein [Candidatus Riflebacteria bacterium]
MKIVISGGTEIGLLFARHLANNNDLHVIETLPQSLNQLEQLDLQIIHGNPTSLAVLQEAKAAEADAFIVCAHSVENIDFFEKLGIDVALSSQFNAIQSVNRQIAKDAIDVFTIFEKDKAEIREIAVPADFPPSRLMDLKLPEGVIIAAIKRGGHTLVPGGEDKVKGKDHLRVFCASDQGETLTDFLMQKVREAAEESEANT